nr:MAG TPA: hypothetical protein [Caudoviricetes sp.]
MHLCTLTYIYTSLLIYFLFNLYKKYKVTIVNTAFRKLLFISTSIFN